MTPALFPLKATVKVCEPETKYTVSLSCPPAYGLRYRTFSAGRLLMVIFSSFRIGFKFKVVFKPVSHSSTLLLVGLLATCDICTQPSSELFVVGGKKSTKTFGSVGSKQLWQLLIFQSVGYLILQPARF